MANEVRTQLVEAAAEGDDELIMKYLDGEELTAEEIGRGLAESGLRRAASSPCFAVRRLGTWGSDSCSMRL